jgi:hypothetical protein
MLCYKWTQADPRSCSVQRGDRFHSSDAVGASVSEDEVVTHSARQPDEKFLGISLSTNP